jgi:AP2 domain
MTRHAAVEPLIRRYEHNYFKGYLVAIERAGRRRTEYFSDKPDGPRAALARARAFRDAMVAKLPPPTKLKRTNVANTSGVIGVSRTREYTRAGRWLVRYVAMWPVVSSQKRAKASFSVAKYGEMRARALAVRARRDGVAAYIAARRRQAAVDP